MIAAWMLYCVAIGLLFVVLGEALERALHLAGRATRWAWVAALAGSYLVPAAALLRPSAFAALPVPLAQPVVAELPATAMDQRVDGALPKPGPSFSLGDLDTALARVWGLSSAALLLSLGAAALRLAALRRGWRSVTVDGRAVLVSDNVGPAVAGLWRSRIVLPDWALQLGEGERRLMLAHEDEHVRARDPWLLVTAAAAVVLAPWNPALWWQVRRLCLAVEMDCDARVLARCDDAPAYGALLLRVGRRRARPFGAPALGEPASFLARRIRRMVTALPRWRWAGVTAAGLVAAAAIIAARETPRPVGPEREARAVLVATPALMARRAMAHSDSFLVEVIRRAIALHYPELLSTRTGPRIEVWFVADSRNQVIRTLQRPGPKVITVGIQEIHAAFPELDQSNVNGWGVYQAPELEGLARDNVRVVWIELREGTSLSGRALRDPDRVLPDSMVDQPPVFLSGPRLRYPNLPRQPGVQGRVVVGAIIDPTGRAEPASVQVIESPHPGLDQAARNAVLQARFRHGRFRGRAVRVLITFPVDFRIS